MEECGIGIKGIRFQFVSNVTKYAPKHYVHIGVLADRKDGEPKILEPDKCESWGWYSLDDLPKPIFLMAMHEIESRKSGKVYSGME